MYIDVPFSLAIGVIGGGGHCEKWTRDCRKVAGELENLTHKEKRHVPKEKLLRFDDMVTWNHTCGAS